MPRAFRPDRAGLPWRAGLRAEAVHLPSRRQGGRWGVHVGEPGGGRGVLLGAVGGGHPRAVRMRATDQLLRDGGAGGPGERDGGRARLISTAEIVDASDDLRGWYRAPGCPMGNRGRRRAEQRLTPTAILYDHRCEREMTPR